MLLKIRDKSQSKKELGSDPLRLGALGPYFNGRDRNSGPSNISPFDDAIMRIAIRERCNWYTMNQLI